MANALAEALGCKVFHVDDAMYEGMEQRKAPAAMAIAEARMADMESGGWIIDGYREQCVKEEWLREADQTVFLNIGKWTCFWSIAGRDVKGYLSAVPRLTARILKPARQADGPQTAASGKKPVSAMTCICKDIQHLGYCLRVEHSPKFESYYMETGGRCSRKFTVLRTRKEIDHFREAILREAKN